MTNVIFIGAFLNKFSKSIVVLIVKNYVILQSGKLEWRNW